MLTELLSRLFLRPWDRQEGYGKERSRWEDGSPRPQVYLPETLLSEDVKRSNVVTFRKVERNG